MIQGRKVLFFTDKISYSGASKIISWVVSNISLPDTEVYLATYFEGEDCQEVKSCVERVRLNTRKKSRLARGSEVVRKLRKFVIENKIDVCVGFLPTECLYLQLAVLGTGIPVVVCERSDPYMEKSVIATIGRFCFRFADGAVFQTDGAKAYYPKRLQKRSVVIPNPVFETKVAYVPYGEREDYIAYSGRLYIRQKRQDILLQAFSKVCEVNNSVKLIIFGDGPDEESLKEMAKELGIRERVCFAGKISNVGERIANCKLFAFSSDYEGIPNSIIEALQAGVPVVSTDCSPGGARMLIQDGINGFVVEREDYSKMAEKILWLMSHQQEAEVFSENAVRICEQFDEKKIICKWRKYICNFLGEK